MAAGARRRVKRSGPAGGKRGGTARGTSVDWLLASDEPAIRGMGREVASPMLTLNALSVLKAAGRTMGQDVP